MINAYEIGVSLILDDKIAGDLTNVEAAFGKVEASVESINTALGQTPGLISAVKASLDDMTSAFQSAAAAAAGIAPGGGYAPGGSAPPPAPLPGETPYVMPGDTAPPRLPTGGGSNLPVPIPGNPYYSGDDGNTFYRSDYKPNWQFGDDTPGLPPAPADDPFNAPGRVSLYPSAGDGHEGGKGGGPGLSDLFFASAGLDMAGRIVAQGYGSVATPQDQITRMELLDKNFNAADGQQALSAAQQVVKNAPGMSLAGALTIIEQGYAQTRDINTAIAMATPLADAALRMEASGNTDAVNQIFDLQRAAELAGALNHKNKDGSVDVQPFTNWVNNAATIAQSTPGVDPHQILLQTQQNDVGAMSANAEGEDLDEILISALGGYKSGTGLAQLNREFTGGKMSTGTEGILVKLGLIDPEGATKTGQYYTLKPGALKDQELFDHNPVKWLEADFIGAINKLNPDDQNAVLHDIYAGTGTASGARVAGDAVLQDTFIARQLYYAQQDEPSNAQSMKIIGNNPSNVGRQLWDNFDVLENAVLNPSMPSVEEWMKWESNRLSGYATHPLKQLWGDTIDGGKALWNFATDGGMPSSPAASIPPPPFIEKIEGFIQSAIKDMVSEIVHAINGQGTSPGRALYVRPIAAGASMPIGQTGHNPAQAPPMPGQGGLVP